jgi:hypothetical protein
MRTRIATVLAREGLSTGTVRDVFARFVMTDRCTQHLLLSDFARNRRLKDAGGDASHLTPLLGTEQENYHYMKTRRHHAGSGPANATREDLPQGRQLASPVQSLQDRRRQESVVDHIHEAC